ncbi:citrate lyase acyl carrier protein [Eubacteriales bacterium OttesenSCG-928-K08]|nr:citrate lyase acyl carrier protein [Eubacteriales bacterium OttesenSCG-928-K08]
MQLIVAGIAGTMESGDILIELEATEQEGVHIDLDSTVSNQYGKQIKRVITETLKDCGIQNVYVKAVDKGALDCTIRARVTAAAHNGSKNEDFCWE